MSDVRRFPSSSARSGARPLPDAGAPSAARTAPGAAAFPTLLSPINVGPFELSSRIVMGSMHTGFEDARADAPKLAAFMAERAAGAGLLVTGGISPDRAGRLNRGTAHATPALLQSHRQVTSAVHEADGRIILQLLHAGRYAAQRRPVSASSTRAPISPVKAHRMSRRQIRRTVDAFGRAAELAIEAGYDGVEIMGSEGYLLNQFLAPRTNRRRDRYGRTPERRRAFPVAVAQRVREAIGPDRLLSFRMSLIDLVPEGQTWEETVALAHDLETVGVDMLMSGIGWHESRVPTIASSVPEAAFAPLSARLREEVGVPVVAANRIGDPHVAERVLADGRGDLVSLARPLLAEPALASKLADGRAREVIACIACNQGCLDRVFDAKTARCLVNPRAGRETDPAVELTPATGLRARRVAVVGAGPAGLEAAIAAARRGFVVTIMDRADDIGGQLRWAATIPGKEEYARAIDSWRARLLALGVGVRLEMDVTADDLAGYDDVVLATGVRPRVVDLPGFDPDEQRPEGAPEVISYADLLAGTVEPGERVAVIGGGGIGVDIAEKLAVPSLIDDLPAWRRRWGVADPGAVRGGVRPVSADARPFPGSAAPDEETRRIAEREVHLLQRRTTKIGADLGRTTGWVHRAELRHAGVIEHRGVAYRRIDADGLHVDEGGAEVVLDVDTVVICAGQESERSLADAIAELERPPRVHVIGGADAAPELDAERAIRQAAEAVAAM